MPDFYSALILLSSLMAGQGTASSDGVPSNQKMDVTVEQNRGKKIEVIDPRHIFVRGDLIRFRFRYTFPGYVYVMNESSSDK